MSKILILTGDLATGKSTYSKIISDKFKVLRVNKDNVKEILGDDIGFKNREENLKLSKATLSIMFYILDNIVNINSNIILEANFHQSEIDRLEKYLANNDILILRFMASDDILYNRFMNRINNENRSLVHQSAGLTDKAKFIEYLNKDRVIDYSKFKMIEVNANNFNYQEDNELLNKLEEFWR